MKKKITKIMDGNSAAAHAAYAFTDVAAIYPITPSSVMASDFDKYASKGADNIFGTIPQITEMQSEAGAAGAMHGALTAGALASTFTSSQGLLLMIPNMYKIAGELLPNVIHVAARTIATHALSIFGDHSDIYACRQTGYAMLCANSPQETFHMAIIAHLSAIKSSLPFMHFFDGFRTSHEMQKIELLSQEKLAEMVDYEALKNFRERGLNSENPCVRGVAQNGDTFFQTREASNIFYDKLPKIVQGYMNKINEIAGTDYKPFNYFGSSNAENIIVAMGSVCETAEEVVDHLVNKGEKVGLVKVRLYRPFVPQFLADILPKSVKKITVLDRTKEPGSIGEPLYLDVLAAVNSFYPECVKMYAGRYGLSSKNTDTAQINAVFENMKNENPKSPFTIGINDDVTHLSLPIVGDFDTPYKGTYCCKFWGIGSDGTVGAAKNTIKIIGENTNLQVQGYFSYDSKKAGGVTVSHLRFGENAIKSTYYIKNSDFVACHSPSYIFKYEILNDLKRGGNLLLNCPWHEDELDKFLPGSAKKFLAENDINFYTIDAAKISRELGLGGRVNIPLQAAFFKIINILSEKNVLEMIQNSVRETYKIKGEEIIRKNFEAAKSGMQLVKKITIPADWKNIKPSDFKPQTQNQDYRNPETEKYVKTIMNPVMAMKGDDLPVSAFLNHADGTMPMGTTKFEKRGIASFVPKWIPENCIQCNFCSMVCPHAVIRPAALTDEEIASAPKNMKYKK